MTPSPSLRCVLVFCLLGLTALGCKGRRCENARTQALPEWERLQKTVDARLALARKADPGDPLAKARFEQINYWAGQISAVTTALGSLPKDPTVVPALEQAVREVSESVHGVNDHELNELLAPARRGGLEVIEHCGR